MKTYYRVELCLYRYEEAELPMEDGHPNTLPGDILDSDLLEEEPFYTSESAQDAYDTLEHVQSLLVHEKIDNLPPAEAEEGGGIREKK